jgi:hypothetical protein
MKRNKRSNQKNQLKKLTQLEALELRQQIRLAGPSQFPAQPTRSMQVRYQATAAVAGNSFTCVTLCRFCGLIAVSATATYCLSTLIKLKRIRIWSPVAVAGTIVTSTIQWPNNSATEQIAGPPIIMTDSATCLSQYAHVDAKPPKGSWCDKWHQAADVTPWVLLTYSAGAIIDFDFQWFIDDLGATIAGPTVAGAVTGAVYHWQVNNLVCVMLNGIS